MRYAHFGEICEKCGNKRNMQQSHISIKLACIYTLTTDKQLTAHVLQCTVT